MISKYITPVLFAAMSLLHEGHAQMHDIKANLSIGWVIFSLRWWYTPKLNPKQIVYPGFTPLDIFGPR